MTAGILPLARLRARHFGVPALLPAASNMNERDEGAPAGPRGVLFDCSPLFGAMPVMCGPLEVAHAMHSRIVATGEGWYADMPAEARAQLKWAAKSMRVVAIAAEPGVHPELEAALADLFDRSGLSPSAALDRMERLEALLVHLGAAPAAVQ